MNALRLVLVGFAGAGLLSSFAWHLASLAGDPVLDTAGLVLCYAIVLVGVPTIVSLLPFRAAWKGYAGWRLALEGAPPWMKRVVLFTGVYAVLNFFMATGRLAGSVTNQSPGFGRVASGGLMYMYSAFLAFLYAAYSRENVGAVWQCANGHRFDDPALECPKCHAELHAVPTRVQPGG
jgi:hypothetical protein